jgi:two-component system, OmpR family, sensor kinase
MRLRQLSTGSASIRRRIVVPTAIFTALGMLLLTGLVQLILAHVVSRDVDNVLSDRANALLRVITSKHGSADPTGAAELADRYVWTFDSSGRLLNGSPIPKTAAGDVREVSTTRTRRAVGGDEFRVLAVPVPQPARPGAPAVVVVGESLSPYETTEVYALVASLAVGVLVVGGVTAIATWTVRRSLEPVATMASRAADWSEHDLSRRFDLGPPRDEITALGQVLDQLLERVSRVILAEQRLTSELAHELRTPLTAIRAEAELLRGQYSPDSQERAALDGIVHAVQDMATTITTLMAAARTAASGEASVSTERVISSAIAAMPAGSPIRRLGTDGADLLIAAPETVAVRAMTPVLENALRYKRAEVAVSVRASGAQVEIVIADDGPGLGDIDPEQVFAPGVQEPGSPGAGLGLALARRLARGVGGDLSLGDGAEQDSGGATFVLALPRSGGVGR